MRDFWNTRYKVKFFSKLRAIFQYMGSPRLQHTSSTQTTLLSFRRINTLRVKQIKFPIMSVISYNLLPSKLFTSPSYNTPLHSLLSFTHTLASWMVSPLMFKQPFTSSIYRFLGMSWQMISYVKNQLTLKNKTSLRVW